jgi:pterin-4a-carbinolamine dehydratase
MIFLKTYEAQQQPEPFKKIFKCKNLVDLNNFVKRIMYNADQKKHHPKIIIEQYTVTIELFTHDKNKVTNKDFDMMEDIQKIYLKI